MHCLLEESIEQEAARFRSAAIEAERELVQIVIKLGGANSPMVNAQPPPIKEACHPMDLGHDNVGRVTAGGNVLRLVFEADSRETVVGSPAIGSNRCSRAHGRLDERNEALGRYVLDTRQADTTGAPTTDFGGNRDNRFLVCFPPCNANLPTAHICFVNLDLAIQKVSARSNHGPAQLMEPCPSRLITAQAEYSLNPKRTDAMLLIRHIPHRLEPKPQRFPRTLEDRPRARRCLTLASRTSLLTPDRHPRLGSPAGRTPKPVRPTDTPKKIRTGGLGSEPVVEFHERARVIDPANGMGNILGHPNILPLRERIGYPITRIVERYGGDHRVRTLSCAEQYRAMAFAQLTYRESLRDIEICLSVHAPKLYHMGFREPVRRSTLADANERRDWRIYAEVAQRLIAQARKLYADEDLGLDLTNTVYALDSTTISLCLSVFPWAHFRTTKAAVKMHTLLDLRGNIPSFIHISDGKLHDVHAFDMLMPEAGAIYVVDRAYIDFARLNVLRQAGAFFITRAKSNMDFHRVYSTPTDRSTGIICDQAISLDGNDTSRDYPELLRRIRFKDLESGKTLVFITNNFILSAPTICALYKSRWQVELFFKWTKQHLRIKQFYGTSENAVKTQIWIAISVYVLVAIVKKRLDMEPSLYTLLQILSVTLFEKISLHQALTLGETNSDNLATSNQLNLLAF